MKLSKILILSLGMALCAAGGVGTALAAVSKSSASSSSSAKYDSAIFLYWGHESSSATLQDMDELVDNVAQYRHLVVSPKSSKALTGTVSVNFELKTVAVEGKTAVLTGLSVKVYEVSSAEAITDENVGSLVNEDNLKCSLSPSQTTGSATFTISAGEAAHETVKDYAIKVVYDGTPVASTEKLSAELTINQSFAA